MLKSREWTQRELGERAAMKQNAIARLENPNYGEYSIRTLQRLAAAFDVALIVKFAPFSEIVNANQNASTADYAPASFTDDPGLSDKGKIATWMSIANLVPNYIGITLQDPTQYGRMSMQQSENISLVGKVNPTYYCHPSGVQYIPSLSQSLTDRSAA
jgi:transcriptional regulator with XRE-family HTH domain